MNRFGKIYPEKNDQLFSYVMYGISSVVLLIIFVENFILSSSFDILRFREIDDVAFQEVLRRAHLQIEAGHLSQLFSLNDYAYGWIFWFPLAIMTYPLYLLSVHFAIDWPLIVTPRQLSLVFGIASLLLIRKILKKYGAPEYLAAAGFLMFLLFPSFGYASLRFGTINEVMFFSVLSVYLAVKDDISTSRGRFLVVSALSLAGGVKLSGLFILPLIFLLVAIRYEFKSIRLFLFDLMVSASMFAVLLIGFSNPSLFFYPFSPSYGKEYFETLSYFMSVAKLETGPPDGLTRFYHFFFGSNVNVICMIFLSCGLVIQAIKKNNNRFDMFAINFIIIASVIYLLNYTYDINRATSYFTSVSFLLLLGILFIGTLRLGKTVLIFMILLQFLDLRNRALLEYNNPSIVGWNLLSSYIKNEYSYDRIADYNEIKNCAGVINRSWSGHIFVDYTVQTGFNSLSYPNACTSIAWNNLSRDGKYCSRSVDYIVLDKNAPGALPKDLFDLKLKESVPKVASGLLIDRESRNNISNGEYFDGRRFVEVCDLKTAKVYSARN
jgi:hypothetical protein